MLQSLAKLLELLDARERRNLALLFLLVVVDALVEILAVAVIPLYVTAIVYPESLARYPLLAGVVDAGAGDRALLVLVSVLLIVFFIGKLGFSVFVQYWRVHYAQQRALHFSLRLFHVYMRAPYTYHLQHNSAELLRNLNSECTGLSYNVLIPAIEFFSFGVILIGICILVVFSVPPMALVWLLLFLGVAGFSGALMQRNARKLGVEAQQTRADMVRTVAEALAGVKELRVLGKTDSFVHRFAVSFDRSLKIQQTMQLLLNAMPNVIELLSIVGLLGVTVMLLLEQHPTESIIATLSIFAVALARMKGMVRGMLSSFTSIRHYSSSLDMVYETLTANRSLDPAYAPSQPSSTACVERTPLRERIELQQVGYRYPEAHEQALQGIDLTIRKGEAIGIVGSTGAGKSTLLDIILGVLLPTAGRLLEDGRDVQNDLAGWQAQIGYVPQQLFLLDGSIRDNIALGVPQEQLDTAQLNAAVEAAALTDFVAAFPAGLDTVIGEDGVRLSGGERQRIAIARALYRNPDILIMDEATSALDNLTEETVIRAIERLKGGRTILMIAHRLSTVRRCDRVVFLKGGRIDDLGSYDELCQRHPEFRAMAMQIKDDG